MLFTKEENKNSALWATEEKSHWPADSTLRWQREKSEFQRRQGHLHTASRFKLHVSGVPGKAPACLPSQSPREWWKAPEPATGLAGESAQRQGQTFQGYLAPGPWKDPLCPLLPWHSPHFPALGAPGCLVPPAWLVCELVPGVVSAMPYLCSEVPVCLWNWLAFSIQVTPSPACNRSPLPLSPSAFSSLSPLWLARTQTQRNLTEQNLSSSLKDLLLQVPPSSHTAASSSWERITEQLK